MTDNLEGVMKYFGKGDILFTELLQPTTDNGKYVLLAIIVLLILYSGYFAPKITNYLTSWLDNTLVRLILLAIIAYVATKNPVVAILLTIGMIVSIQTSTAIKSTARYHELIPEQKPSVMIPVELAGKSPEVLLKKSDDLVVKGENAVVKGDELKKNGDHANGDKLIAKGEEMIATGEEIKKVVEKMTNVNDGENNLDNITMQSLSDLQGDLESISSGACKFECTTNANIKRRKPTKIAENVQPKEEIKIAKDIEAFDSVGGLAEF
jgi:hypothetical protein